MKGSRNRKHERMISSLIKAGGCIADASSSSGISEPTFYRALREEGFQEAYRAARKRLVDEAVLGLQRVTGKAVSILDNIMNNETVNPSSRVQAARIILDMSIKTSELADLVARVEALERRGK